MATLAEIQARYPLNAIVEVTKGYRMGGTFVADGFEGEWFVRGHVGPGVCSRAGDLELSRFHGDDAVVWCVTLQRIKGDPAALSR